MEAFLTSDGFDHLAQRVNHHAREFSLVGAPTDRLGQDVPACAAHDVLGFAGPASLFFGNCKAELDDAAVVKRMPRFEARKRAFALIHLADMHRYAEVEDLMHGALQEIQTGHRGGRRVARALEIKPARE